MAGNAGPCDFDAQNGLSPRAQLLTYEAAACDCSLPAMPESRPPAPRYDEWADWYESYVTADTRSFTDRATEALIRVLGPGTGPALDLACGTGIFASALRQLGWTPVGLDLSMRQLQYARGRMPVVAADAVVPPVRPSVLAAVAAVMCHTDIDDYAVACRAASQALKPGGVLAHVGVHPCYVGAFADRSDPDRIRILPGYWRTERRFDAWSSSGVRARVGATHLPLSNLLNAFIGAGLVIEQVIELGSPVPSMLAVRCIRPVV
jgi:SAM-dependent methyltransferase